MTSIIAACWGRQHKAAASRKGPNADGTSGPQDTAAHSEAFLRKQSVSVELAASSLKSAGGAARIRNPASPLWAHSASQLQRMLQDASDVAIVTVFEGPSSGLSIGAHVAAPAMPTWAGPVRMSTKLTTALSLPSDKVSLHIAVR